MSALLTLNDDVLIRVLIMLSIKDQQQLRGVCQRLRRTCDSDRLWSLLCRSGSIAPAPSVSWKLLGQRLACHKWSNNPPSSVLMPPRDDAISSQQAQDADAARPRSEGRWITVFRSGIRYATYPQDVLPLVDTVASSKALSDHKGNNTATIGLIPIGLSKPAAHEDETTGVSPADDPAISLHKKLFSAMGVTFNGDWDSLCDVMRPVVSSDSRPTTVTPQQPRTNPQAQQQQRATNTNISVNDIDVASRRHAGAASELIPIDPTAPSLAMFDTMPHLGPRRVMAMCLSPGKVEDHPNATARLAEVILTTCSTVVFAAKSAEALHAWLALISPHMSLVTSPSPFSTADNTPNVVFMTSSPIASLREVVAASRNADGSSSGRPSEGAAALISALAFINPTKEAFSWILNRTSCVGEVVFGDESCPLSLKTFYAPAWVAPECSLPVPAPAITRMLLAAGEANGNANTDQSLWTREVVQAMCEGQSRQCASFYEQAMRTEIADANKPLIAFTDLPVPMDPAEMVSIQDHFFYASLRSYAMAVRHACGSDTALGMALLEEFKKDISTSFRKLWAENIAMSRAYCTRLFEGIFHPLHEKYNGETSNGFQDKRGLHTWFGAVTDKISEYIIKAKGPRKMDVLAERITTRTIGGLKNFCIQHPEHPHIHIEDVALAGNEITSYCAKQLATYHSEQDEVLSVKQRNSAMYTACLGTMWGCESVTEAIKYLSMLGPEYDTWAELLQLKREGFGLAPTAVLSLTVTSVHPPAPRCENNDYETDGTVEASETNSVSASSEVRSSTAARSRASTRGANDTLHTPTIPQAQPTSGERVMSMLTNFWARGTASASPPQQDEPSTTTLGGVAPPHSRRSTVRSMLQSKLKPRDKKPLQNSVVLTELEVERQGQLQALMRKHSEHKQRMETVGKQLNLRSDETADFNVIQRQFSSGFKDYRTTRKVEDAADEIASRLRIMRERVRNSFSSTRER